MEFEHATLVSRLSTFDVYKRVNLKKMSYSTLKQMDDVEAKRVEDIANGIKGNKREPDGMRRKIEPYAGMKVAPEKFLGSHVGRAQQRFDKEDGSRLLSSVVVSRPAEEGGGQVLLISSSNPTKRDWLLPKGGWDKGEKNNMAALREVIEEGGMDGQLAHALGKLKFSEGDNKITYIAYMMKGATVYDDWSESLRYRIWVSYDEAIDLLDNRPQMIEVVKRAKIVDEKVKAV